VNENSFSSGEKAGFRRLQTPAPRTTVAQGGTPFAAQRLSRKALQLVPSIDPIPKRQSTAKTAGLRPALRIRGVEKHVKELFR
jgi:hypothetical protein